MWSDLDFFFFFFKSLLDQKGIWKLESKPPFTGSRWPMANNGKGSGTQGSRIPFWNFRLNAGTQISWGHTFAFLSQWLLLNTSDHNWRCSHSWFCTFSPNLPQSSLMATSEWEGRVHSWCGLRRKKQWVLLDVGISELNQSSVDRQ